MLLPRLLILFGILEASVLATSLDIVDGRVLVKDRGAGLWDALLPRIDSLDIAAISLKRQSDSDSSDPDEPYSDNESGGGEDVYTIADFAPKGEAMMCLMRNTADGAQTYADGNPFLHGKQLASPWSSYQDLSQNKWFNMKVDEYDQDFGLSGTRDARSDPKIGGGQAEDENFKGVNWQWDGSTVKNSRGSEVVSLFKAW